MSLVQLGSHIRIEESLDGQESDKNEAKSDVGQPSVHMVEGNTNNQNHKGKGVKRKFEGWDKPNKKLIDLVCWRCHTTGHAICGCHVNLNTRAAVNNGAGNNNGGNNGSNGSAPLRGGQISSNLDNSMNYDCSLLPYSLYVQDNDCTWWVDSGATIHMCRDR